MINSYITSVFGKSTNRYEYRKVYEYFCIVRMLRLKLYLKNPLKFYMKALHVTSTLSVTIYLYFNHTKLQLSLCLVNTDNFKRTELPIGFFLCPMYTFYFKCWQSATGMHHKIITSSLKKKNPNICHIFGCFRRLNLKFQVELVNVVWTNVMLWKLARWLQIIFHMQLHRDCLHCILLTHKDYINFCFIPVFQGKQCCSETTLNIAIYLYKIQNTQSKC